MADRDKLLQYEEIFLAEQSYDIGLGMKHSSGLIRHPIAKVGNEAYLVLKSAGYTPRIYDLESMTLQELSECKVLWIVSDESMDAGVQKNLADYMRKGGKLIINGRVPDRTADGEICTILADVLGISVKRVSFEEQDQEKILLDGTEYCIGKNVQPIETGQNRVLAVTADGRPAVLLAKCGAGSGLVIPFALERVSWGTTEAIGKMLDRIQVQPQIIGAKKLRVIPKQGERYIVMNFNQEKVTETITLVEEDKEKQITATLEPHSFLVLN